MCYSNAYRIPKCLSEGVSKCCATCVANKMFLSASAKCPLQLIWSGSRVSYEFAVVLDDGGEIARGHQVRDVNVRLIHTRPLNHKQFPLFPSFGPLALNSFNVSTTFLHILCDACLYGSKHTLLCLVRRLVLCTNLVMILVYLISTPSSIASLVTQLEFSQPRTILDVICRYMRHPHPLPPFKQECPFGRAFGV